MPQASYVFCDNCAKKSHWKDVCEHCGYKIELAKHKWGNTIKVVFCSKPGCGCNYTNYCPTHGEPEEEKTPTDWPPRSDQ